MKLHRHFWIGLAMPMLFVVGCGDSSHKDAIVIDSSTTPATELKSTKRKRPPAPESDDSKSEPAPKTE